MVNLDWRRASGTRVVHRSWRTCLLLAAIIAASVAVRMYGLYGRSMWFDESSSWRTIGFPLREMFTRIARNIHAPLFYVLLKGWVAMFGESIVSLRTFSLVFAAIATAAVFLFASIAFAEHDVEGRPRTSERGRWIGLVAAALFAASYFQIRLAREIRMYSLGTALVFLSSWLLFRAIRAPRPSLGDWSLYGVVTLLFAWTHHFALFSIAAQAMFLIGYLTVKHRRHLTGLWRDPETRCVVLGYAIIGGGWCLWLPVFLEQQSRVQSGWWTDPLSFHKVAEAAYGMFFDKYVHGRAPTWEVGTLAATLLVICALLVRARKAEWYVAAMAAVPFGLAICASARGTSIMVNRYFAFAQPFLLIAVAALLWRLPGRLLRTGAACLLALCLLGVHLVFLQRTDIERKPGARGAAVYLDANRQPEEPVIACSHFVYYPLLYYTRYPAGWYVFSSSGTLSHYHGGPIAREGEVIDWDDVKRIASGKVWVITSSSSSARGERFMPPDWQLRSRKSFQEWVPFQKNVVVLEFMAPEARSGD